jgi:cytochrome c-type biogenesis protein CcmH
MLNNSAPTKVQAVENSTAGVQATRVQATEFNEVAEKQTSETQSVQKQKQKQKVEKSSIQTQEGFADTNVPIAAVPSKPEIQERFKTLASELRCLVCQNQSLADSQAGLAEDLKQKVYEQIASGRSDQEIKTYMVDRYGEFILYKPGLSLDNAVLWVGPFIILALAVAMALSWLKREKHAHKTVENTVQPETAAALEALYQRSKF